MTNLNPEQRARVQIDAMLTTSGWIVQDYRSAAIATTGGIEPDDFGCAPFSQRGGLGKTLHLFDDDLPQLLEELNSALAA